MKKELSVKSQKTIEALKAKAESAFSKVRMPSLKNISDLLTELEILHKLEDSYNTVEYRSGGNRYVNSRHRGKEGKKLTIDLTKEQHELIGYGIKLDTSDSYYSWNTDSYAYRIIKLIELLRGVNRG